MTVLMFRQMGPAGSWGIHGTSLDSRQLQRGPETPKLVSGARVMLLQTSQEFGVLQIKKNASQKRKKNTSSYICDRLVIRIDRAHHNIIVTSFYSIQILCGFCLYFFSYVQTLGATPEAW